MIVLQVPVPEPLYEVLWSSRRRDESVPAVVVRGLVERFLGRSVPSPAVPSAPILSYVEVIE